MRALSRLLLFPRFAIPRGVGGSTDLAGLVRLWRSVPRGRVEAWLLPGDGASPEHPGPAVVFAHGNAELIEHWPDLLAPYRRMGLSVLLPEYRGYGRSDGSPSEPAIVEDFEAFYDLLVARPEVDPRRVVLHGRSLGGGAVCALAARRPAAALILQSTFTSVADVAHRWLVPRSWIADRFESLPIVQRLECPVLVVHGSHDRLVPFSHGRALAEAARRGRLVPVDADHNDCPPDWTSFWREVEAFLVEASVLARPTPAA